MIASPSARFTAALKGSHERQTLLTLMVWNPDGTLRDAGPVQLASGTLSIDSTTASWRRFTGEIVVPPSTARGLDGVNTFNGELRVEAGIAFANGQVDKVQIAQLRIEESSRNTGRATTSVTAFDRAARVADFPFITPYAPRDMGGALLTTIEAIKDIIATAFPSNSQPTFIVSPDLNATAYPPEETTFTGGRWDAVLTLAQSIAAVVHNDRLGRFVIRPKASEEIPVLDIISGVNGTLVDLASSSTRVEQYNAVGLSCESPSKEAIFVYIVDDDPTSPTYYDGPFGRKPYLTRNDAISDEQAAIAAARGILARRKSAARDLTLNAIYNPLLEPMDSVFVSESQTAVQEIHIVESMELPLTGGKMSMRTFRWSLLALTWLDLRAGRTWSQVPSATTWITAVRRDDVTPAA